MPKVFKSLTSRPSHFKRLLTFTKEHSWLLNFGLTIFVLLLTQYQLHVRSQPIVVADCQLSDNKGIQLEFERSRTSVLFETVCAVRNVGAIAIELIDVRSGLTFNGSLLQDPQPLLAAPSETARNVLVNSESLSKPVPIQSGGQASVVAFLRFSFYAGETEKITKNLVECNKRSSVRTTADLNACISTLGLSWTDFLRGAEREYLSEFDQWTIADGIAGVFILSAGNFIVAPVQFRHGWGWRCEPTSKYKLRAPPKYVNCGQSLN